MYLSRLILNPRSREVRRDLADCHDLHRTILSAFPQAAKSGDGARSQFGVLHRLDVECGRLVLLVQSQEKPDWSKLNPEYLTIAANGENNPACKPIEEFYDRLMPGMSLLFRLRANPTKKIDTRSGPDGARRNGRRIELRDDAEQIDWLRKKGEAGGFRLLSVQITKDVPDVQARPEGKSFGRRRANGAESARLTFGSVLFEGRLEITDAVAFRDALANGIGSAKGYGFGLLSIARVKR